MIGCCGAWVVVYRIVDADLAEPFGSVMTLRVRTIGERGGLYVYVVVNFVQK